MEQHLSMLKNLMQLPALQMTEQGKKLILRENQVVLGHVLKLFPDQKALVQIGHSKLVAQLEAPMKALESYWFIVRNSEQLQLQIMKQAGNNSMHNQQLAAKDLLRIFQQPISRVNLSLTNELLKANLPISKVQLTSSLEFLGNMPKNKIGKAVEAILFTIKQNLPVNEIIIKSVMETYSGEPVAKQIEKLYHSLPQETQTHTVKQLADALKQVMNLTKDLKNITKSDVMRLFTDMEQKLGLADEIKLLNSLKVEGENQLKELQTLKNILITASKDTGLLGIREPIDQLIYRLNGLMLLNQDQGPMQQFISQIPIFINNNPTDLTIHWNGKKKQNGELDPAFCRILFYFQLPKLNETVVDVHIQNSIISIIVNNNTDHLGSIIDIHGSNLKSTLSEMGYQVSSIQVKPFMVSSTNPLNQIAVKNADSYTGVDLKV